VDRQAKRQNRNQTKCGIHQRGPVSSTPDDEVEEGEGQENARQDEPDKIDSKSPKS
jgi:hypothetical protein